MKSPRSLMALSALLVLFLAACPSPTSGGGGGGGGPTPPTVSDFEAYPGATKMVAHFKVNQSATVYGIVVPNNSQVPTAAQVKAGVDYDSVTVTASGNKAVNANSMSTILFSSLSASTAYDIYLVAENTSGFSTVVSKINKSTQASDTTPPTASFPGLFANSSTSISAYFNPNEPSFLYALLVSDGATPPPTASELKNNSYANSSAIMGYVALFSSDFNSTGISTVLPFTGLTPNTDFDLYLLVEDIEGNLSSVIGHTNEFTTKPVGVGLPAMGYNQAIAQGVGTSSGTLYSILVNDTATPPNATQVKNATGSMPYYDLSVTFLKKAQINVSAPTPRTDNPAYILTFTGLVPNTSYKVYTVLENSSGNLSDVHDFPGTTLVAPDTAAPNISSHSPFSGSRYINGIISLDEGGFFYALLVPDNATAPAVAQVVAGTYTSKVGHMKSFNVYAFYDLAPNTQYDLYIVTEDAQGNRSSPPNKYDVFTLP